MNENAASRQPRHAGADALEETPSAAQIVFRILLRRGCVLDPATTRLIAEALQALYLARPDETLQAMFPAAPPPTSRAAPAPARPPARQRPPARGSGCEPLF